VKTLATVRRNGVQAAGLIWTAAPATAAVHGLTTLVGAVTPVAAAWLTKLVFDGITRPGDGGHTLLLAIALALVGTAAAVLPQLSAYLSAQLGRSVGVRALDRLFAATERFVGIAPFEDPAFLDRMRLAQQGTGTAAQLTDGAFGVCRGLLAVLGFVGSLLVISPVMTVAVLCAAIPALFAELAVARRRADTAWRVSPAQRREFFYSTLLGSVSAATEIRLFGLHRFLRERMITERGAADAQQRGTEQRALLLQTGPAVISAVVAGAGLVWAVSAARRGQLTVGDLSMFVAAVAGVQAALYTTVASITGLHRQLLLFDHYTAVVGAEPDLPARSTPVPALRHGIELRDVWFRYGPDQPWILRGVNLFLPHGHAVGLVGVNGAGKSTIVKLLCRLYDPTRGEIRWDGVDLRELAPAELRRRVSAVFQDFMRYDMSAADNIGLADVSARADRDRVRQAADRAGADELLSGLPFGYDTLLTKLFFQPDPGTGGPRPNDRLNGVQLSGGQWQRIALARAFMRADPDLMILDEASSGLDPAAEHDLNNRTRLYRRGRTSLLISHRLNIVREADTIVVLDGGTVVEQGGHDELLAADGCYARLFRTQAQGFADAAPRAA